MKMRSLINRSAFSAAASIAVLASAAAGQRRPGGEVPAAGTGACAAEQDLYPSWLCEAQIRAIPERGIVSAWDARDADAFAAHFARDASFILSQEGVHLAGRRQIQAFTAYRLARLPRGAKLVEEALDVTSVSPNVAVVVTRGGIVLPGDGAEAASHLVTSTWVIARKHGEWLITAYHDSLSTPC
jgi:uncharacterized protein (TIGR02246 family)